MVIKQLNIKRYNEIIKTWDEAGLPIKLTGRDSFENIKIQLESGRVVILADLEANDIRGLVLLSHDERKGWINRLAVKPQYQHQGTASDLVTAAEKFFFSQGIEIFAVLIETENTASINFFEKNNYKKCDNIQYFTKKLRDDI